MEKPKQTFWPTQYIIMRIGSVMLVNSEFFFNLEHLRVGRLLSFESRSYFFFFFFLNLHNCISFAKHQNESATGIRSYFLNKEEPGRL